MKVIITWIINTLLMALVVGIITACVYALFTASNH